MRRKQREKYHKFLNTLKDKGLYPWAVKYIATKMSLPTWDNMMSKRVAKELKMRYSDYIISYHTVKLKNNRLVWKLHQNNFIKPYKETDKWVRILKR